MTDSDLDVLQLVTAREIFFDQQIETLEAKGVDCTVCPVPGGEQIDGAMPEQRGPLAYLRYLPKVRRALREKTFDLIHANYGLTAPFAITQRSLPIMLTLWGSDVLGFDGYVTKSCAWRCDLVTVRSEEMREQLGDPSAKIMPSGINMERFRPIDRQTARKEVGWNLRGTHVLFPYDPSYRRKNYSLAKDVVAETRKETKMEISLQTVSGVKHSKMPFYINAADCLLLTSKYEGSPNTVKEALACNVPVVSTDVGDVRERLRNVRGSGVSDDLEELVSLLAAGINAGRTPNGRTQVREVSWDRIGDQIIEFYRAILR